MKRLDALAAVVALVAVTFLACSPDPLDGAVPQSGPPPSVNDPAAPPSAPTTVEARSTTTAVVVPATAAPAVTAAPTTTTPTVVAQSARSGIEALIYDAFPGEGAKAVRVFRCESELDPSAVSPTDDHGVAQIHAPLWVDAFERVTGVPFFDGVYDAALNLQFAAWLRGEQGWEAWACA